jgi:hypothetical protein
MKIILKARLRALNDLLNYAPNEVISIGSWKILCPNLILALGDTNLEIAVRSFYIILKTFDNFIFRWLVLHYIHVY